MFDQTITGYNGAAGPFEAMVNMGPVQLPQRKGLLPQYHHNKLVELQQKFDDLEAQGVFHRLEDISITIEYLNPSFLTIEYLNPSVVHPPRPVPIVLKGDLKAELERLESEGIL